MINVEHNTQGPKGLSTIKIIKIKAATLRSNITGAWNILLGRPSLYLHFNPRPAGMSRLHSAALRLLGK